MAASCRERITIDLRGLGPTLRASAAARGLTVSELARHALTSTLDVQDPQPERFPPGSAGNGTAKLTVRLAAPVANRFTDSARAAGLSYGAYLTTCLDGAPAPALPADHKELVAALVASTDQLATLAADLRQHVRGADRTAPADIARELMSQLLADVRNHLGIASSAIQESAATRPGHASRRAARREDGSAPS